MFPASRSRGIPIPTLGQLVIVSVCSVTLWWGWQEARLVWKRQQLWNPDATPTELIRAAGAWTEQGAEAVPELKAALTADDPQTRRYAAMALAQLGPRGRDAISQMRASLRDPSPLVRRQVVAALAAVDPESPQSIAAAARLLSDPDRGVRDDTAAALRTWGAPAIEIVSAQLDNSSSEVRRLALSVFPRTRAAQQTLAPRVRPLTHDVEDSVRELAICYVAESGTASLAELTEWLAINSDPVREVVIPALRSIGPDARQAIPQLLACLDGSRPRDSLQVIETLRSLGEAAADAAPAFLERARTAQDWEALPMLQAVEVMGKTRNDLAQGLSLLTMHRNPTVAGTALRILLEHDPEAARKHIESLVDALRDDNRVHYRRTCGQLAQLGPAAAQALPALLMRLREDRPEFRYPTLSVLRALGAVAAPAVPQMIRDLERAGDDLAWSDALVETLLAVGPPAASAGAPIFQRLRDLEDREGVPMHEFRLGRMMVAAATVGLRTPPFRSIVHQALRGDHPALRIAALESLAFFDYDAEERGMVLETLEASDPATRITAVRTLAQAFGPRPETMRVLADRLTDPEPWVRAAAAIELGRMGGSAEQALPRLRTAAEEADNLAIAPHYNPQGFAMYLAYRRPMHEEIIPQGESVATVMERAIHAIESASAKSEP